MSDKNCYEILNSILDTVFRFMKELCLNMGDYTLLEHCLLEEFYVEAILTKKALIQGLLVKRWTELQDT